MKIEIELPEDVVRDLERLGDAESKCLGVVAAEVLRRAVRGAEPGFGTRLEERPDWVEALERGSADIAAGRVVEHEDVIAWHRAHAG